MSTTNRFRPARRHPTYYLFDGNIVLLESNTLYCLHRSTLSLDSACFGTLFSLPQENTQEGTDDAHPVVIPSIRSQEFDYFLDYHIQTYKNANSRLPSDNEDALIAVLNLAHFFQIAVAHADARRALEHRAEFRPALRYALGIKNQISEWIMSGFRELVDLPLHTLKSADVERMGLAAYHTLVVTKSSIESHRKYIAYLPPAVQHAPTCPFDIECRLGWQREWKGGVARRLLHPEMPISGAAILEALDDVEINDMHVECKKLTLAWLRNRGTLTREEVIVEEAIQGLAGC
ncbi:hypothetical protein FKP32DRAFT_1582933 [Trametes sanguinea]|nr:hypothetical protein FKP32DRAFT_1582933 [Trametes sanguinea]